MNEINRLLNEMEDIHDRVVNINKEFQKSIAIRKLTKEEIFEQRVSYIYGQSEGVSKDQIRMHLIGTGYGAKNDNHSKH